MIKEVVIPVAGLGTRFLPASKAVPKEMLPIADRPLIQYVVEEALASGIKEIIFVTRQGKSAIEDYFDTAFELETVLERKGKKELLSIARSVSQMIDVISVRQKQPLGLGHAILCARPLISEDAFAVILPDDLIDSKTPCLSQLISIYKKTKATVVAIERLPQELVSSYGVIAPEPIEERLYKAKELVEKPSPEEAPSNLAVIGRYVLTKNIFPILEYLPPGRGGEIQLTDAINELSQTDPIYAYEFEGKRYDCGDKLGYLKANVIYGLRHPKLGEEFKAFLKELELSDNS